MHCTATTVHYILIDGIKKNVLRRQFSSNAKAKRERLRWCGTALVGSLSAADHTIVIVSDKYSLRKFLAVPLFFIRRPLRYTLRVEGLIFDLSFS